MAFSYLEVVGVVARRDLNASCTKVFINVFIGDNGDLSSNERKDERFADDIFISFVIGAGSVVVKDIPPMSFAAGNPCKVIRPITEADSMIYKPEILADNSVIPEDE